MALNSNTASTAANHSAPLESALAIPKHVRRPDGLFVAHRQHFVLAHAAWCLKLRNIAFELADQGTCDRARD